MRSGNFYNSLHFTIGGSSGNPNFSPVFISSGIGKSISYAIMSQDNSIMVIVCGQMNQRIPRKTGRRITTGGGTRRMAPP
jgi:hypothetical protein